MADLDGDLYVELAVQLFGSTARSDDKLRARGKQMLLGLFYGRGAKSISRELEVNLHEAQDLVERTWARYPTLESRVRHAKLSFSRLEVVTTMSGRPIPPPSKGLYQVLNYIAQANAADIFAAAVGRVAAHLGAESLFLSIHDELVVMVPDSESESARQVLADHERCSHARSDKSAWHPIRQIVGIEIPR